MGKQVIGDPVVIDGRTLSLSRAVRAGDLVFLTGQVPMVDGEVMTTGSIEDQTRVVLDLISETLALAGCTPANVVKSMVWLRSCEDFAGFNEVYGDYFVDAPPARSALISDFLVDVRVEVECVAYDPAGGAEANRT